MKKVKTYKGWAIYKGYNTVYVYSAFLPESDIRFDSPEFEADNVQELIDNINCY